MLLASTVAVCRTSRSQNIVAIAFGQPQSMSFTARNHHHAATVSQRPGLYCWPLAVKALGRVNNLFEVPGYISRHTYMQVSEAPGPNPWTSLNSPRSDANYLIPKDEGRSSWQKPPQPGVPTRGF